MRVGNIDIRNDRPFTLIAGPCQIESREHAIVHALYLKELTDRLGIPFIYKSSFDKANRTSGETPRGVGYVYGLEILSDIRKLGIKTTTDFHNSYQITAAPMAVEQSVDLIQIPAFLCRQTDLLYAAGYTGKSVNVKKGQFCAPEDMKYVVEKIKSTGNQDVMLTERGTTFGYHNLVVDYRSLVIMRGIAPICFDATHSVQYPAGGTGQSGGAREFVPYLATAAVAVGVAALFMECHEDPDNAPSDGPCMMRLDEMEKLLIELKHIDQYVKHETMV